MTIRRLSDSIGIGRFLSATRFLYGVPLSSLTSSFITVSNGWTLQLSLPGLIGGTFDVGTDVAPKVSVSVTSRSWSTLGIETTKTRNVYGKIMLREPYPDQLSRDETQSGVSVIENIVLNDFIYADDVINSITVLAGFFTDDGVGGTGLANEETVLTGVVNNSTEAYPLPVGAWLNHDLERVEANTHTVRMAMAHRHFGQGQPVRAVKFIATDMSLNTSETYVSSLSSITYTASGLTAPCFEGTLDFTGLAQGEMVTIDAIIYPWVGDAFQVSVDGSSYPSPNLTTLKVLNDRTGAYGTAYAYVDGVGGGTPAVSETPGTAQANPYATVASAAAAVQAYNNANFSRNSASGGVVRLEVFDHVHSDYSAVAVDTIPLLIEASNPANKATTIYQDSGASISDGIPNYLKIKDVTLKKIGGSVIFLDSAGTITSANALILENCTFDRNGTSIFNAWIYKTSQTYLIGCDGDDCGQANGFSTASKQTTSIGCGGDGNIGTGSYSTVACKDLNARHESAPLPNAGMILGEGVVIGFNHIGNGDNGIKCLEADRGYTARGLAIVGNIFEQYGGTTGPAFFLSADGNTEEALNIIEHSNTIVGSRSNLLYQDTGSVTVQKQGISSHSVHYLWNSKSDVFGSNSNLIGNWSTIYRIGSSYNVATHGASDGEVVGIGHWLGELEADGDVSGTTVTPVVTDWVDDQSFTVAGTGGGDYTPGALTELPQIPAGETAYNVDLYGRVISTDGTAYVGAVQKV